MVKAGLKHFYHADLETLCCGAFKRPAFEPDVYEQALLREYQNEKGLRPAKSMFDSLQQKMINEASVVFHDSAKTIQKLIRAFLFCNFINKRIETKKRVKKEEEERQQRKAKAKAERIRYLKRQLEILQGEDKSPPKRARIEEEEEPSSMHVELPTSPRKDPICLSVDLRKRKRNENTASTNKKPCAAAPSPSQIQSVQSV